MLYCITDEDAGFKRDFSCFILFSILLVNYLVFWLISLEIVLYL